jgi:Clp amino terminal domain, pathogenicity island component
VNPAPGLQELIESVEADASSNDALDQLSHASRTATGLEEISDALLGHFVDRSRRSGHSWTQISAALGVTKQAAHKRFSFAAMTFEPHSPTFERFTPRAKAVLDDAAEQARLRARTQTTTEDILLALFEPAEAIAAQVLQDAGITPEACEHELGAAPVKGTETESTDRRPFSEPAKNALRSAVEEALRLGHNYVGTEHLLLGLYHDPEDPAASALSKLGLDYANAKDELTRKLAEHNR